MSEPLDDRALQRLLAMAAADDAPAPITPLTLPARYELVRELGRGGMGVVYEVIDRQLDRRCALKVLGAGAGADEALRARFAREAAAAARLRHPHIAAVHDATPEFITMQLVAGGPIGAAPELPARRAVELVRDAALALQHAHERGIVHRDLKPSNLLVEGSHVYVVDFGLAKTIDATHSLSLAGAVVGTPAFMPPEQALGQQHRIDARSDVYGLGATLFYCLTGEPPFTAADLPALLRSVVDEPCRPTRIDRDLDLVLAKCLAKEPEHRYATAAEFAADLDRWLRDEPVLARRPSWLYRTQKRLQRQRRLWRAVAIAVAATALVLTPIWLRESAARDAANEAVQLTDHASAVLQDAALSTAMGDWSSTRQRVLGGIAPLQRFLQRHDVPRMRYLLARLLRTVSQPDAALAELDRAIAMDPALVDARFERGLLLAAKTTTTAAERELAIADLSVGVGVGSLSVLRDVDRLFGKAELLRLQGDNHRAMEILREVLEYDGLHVPARLSMAAAASAQGDDARAVYYSASALDLQQGFGPFYLSRERQALPTSLLDLQGALVDYADTLQGAQDNTLGVARRGLVHLRRALRAAEADRVSEAIDAVNDAIADHDTLLAQHDTIAGAFNNRAVCELTAEQLHHRAGDAAGAAAARLAAARDVATALRLQPELPEANCNAGFVALRQAEVSRALGRVEITATERAAAAAAFGKAIDCAPAGWSHLATCRTRLAQVREPVATSPR